MLPQHVINNIKTFMIRKHQNNHLLLAKIFSGDENPVLLVCSRCGAKRAIYQGHLDQQVSVQKKPRVPTNECIVFKSLVNRKQRGINCCPRPQILNTKTVVLSLVKL